MHPAAETYLEANAQRLRDWMDKRLSVEAPKAEAASTPTRYRVPLFPPAPLRPFSRPFLKRRRA